MFEDEAGWMSGGEDDDLLTPDDELLPLYLREVDPAPAHP